MPLSARQITPEDLLPSDQFAARRSELRTQLLPTKRLRRTPIGPYATAYFENYETMLFQVQEMLHIEKGGREQMDDELRAYNPLIPQGNELVATIMFEVDDAPRRTALLARLGNVEEKFFLEVDGERLPGIPEGDAERTREDGKASSVHFIHFPLSERAMARFTAPDARVFIGVEHPNYAHQALLQQDQRTELARDFASAKG